MHVNAEVAGPVYLRCFHLAEICHVSEGHQHHYDHLTLVVRGGIRVTYKYLKDGQIVEGETTDFGPGEHLTIKAEVFHTIKALAPDTVYVCIFSHRDFDGAVVQEYGGNTRAYDALPRPEDVV